MKGADVRGTVAEVGDRDPLLTAHLRRERQSVGNRHGAADDTGGHHHAARRMSDVHRTTLALAGARGLAGNLGPELAHRHALGQHVVNAAVDRADVILVRQIHRYRGRNDLLPTRRVVRRDDLAGLDHRAETLIVLLDQRHAPIDIDEHRAHRQGFAVADRLRISKNRSPRKYVFLHQNRVDAATLTRVIALGESTQPWFVRAGERIPHSESCLRPAGDMALSKEYFAI